MKWNILKYKSFRFAIVVTRHAMLPQLVNHQLLITNKLPLLEKLTFVFLCENPSCSFVVKFLPRRRAKAIHKGTQSSDDNKNKKYNIRTAGNRINTATNFMNTLFTKICRDALQCVSTFTKIREITKIIVLTVIFGLNVMSANAQVVETGTCGDGVEYTISGTASDLTLTIYYTGTGTGAMYDYVESGGVSTAPWVAQSANLKTLVINDSVVTIGNYAFFDPYGNFGFIGDLIIPNSVVSIGNLAFYGCSGFDGNLIIGSSVQTIGAYAFYGCRNLSSIICHAIIPPTFTWEDVFNNLLTSIPVYVPCVNFYRNAFGWSDFSNFIEIPATPININGTFENLTWTITGSTCDDITLTISGNGQMPYYFISIPWQFYLNRINEIIIENGVTSVGGYAFAECSSLSSVTIPNSVTTIGGYAFWNCSSLSSITIPSSVAMIGDNAFWNCSSLSSITCNAIKPPTLGTDAFYNFPAGIPVYVPCVSAYSVADGWTNFTNFIEIPTIPINISGTTGDLTWTITGSTCDSGYILTISGNGTMPNYNYIFYMSPWYAYQNVINVIIIGDAVTSIGNFAFVDFSSLSSLTIPNSVTSIGDYAFANCGLTSITIPSSVTSIGNRTFSDCGDLTDVSVNWTTPLAINSNVFNNLTLSNINLHVPMETECTYKSYSVWGDFNVIGASFFTITASAGSNGSISPSGITNIYCGTNYIFTFTPNAGYRIERVLINGENNPTAVADGSYTFENVTKDQTIHVTFTNVIGINDYETASTTYVVLPNPTTGQLRIINYESSMEEIGIYDVMGRVVFTTPLFRSTPPTEGNITTLDISHLPAGVYYLRIGTETAKIVKQ